MREFSLALDFLLDDSDLQRLANSRPKYLYTTQSKGLYLKHINHLSISSEYMTISYGKEQHEIINLTTKKRQKFLINHENLDEYYSVATGATDTMAMIAIGDSYHTRIQIADIRQPFKVYMNTTYMEDDSSSFPVPRYFEYSENEVRLIYSDSSKLIIDLQNFEIKQRDKSTIGRIIKPHTLTNPLLSILGPFVLITLTDRLQRNELLQYQQLLKLAEESAWLAVDTTTVIHRQLAIRDTHDFDDLITTRTRQLKKLKQLLDEL